MRYNKETKVLFEKLNQLIEDSQGQWGYTFNLTFDPFGNPILNVFYGGNHFLTNESKCFKNVIGCVETLLKVGSRLQVNKQPMFVSEKAYSLVASLSDQLMTHSLYIDNARNEDEYNRISKQREEVIAKLRLILQIF